MRDYPISRGELYEQLRLSSDGRRLYRFTSSADVDVYDTAQLA